MIEEIKELHPDFLCLYKVGSFYHAYGRDASIMSFLFDYKIKELGNNHKECGFPIGAVSKVTAKLQNSNLSYLLIDRRNNYDVDEKEDYKEDNRYSRIFERANKYVNRKKRINNISQYLEENIEKENLTKILTRMEEIMYEEREV